MSSTKISVNGSSTSSTPELQDQITLALLQNGGVGRIQTALQQRLDESGWTENLRSYVLQLFRSGECTTFFEAVEKVKKHINIEGVETTSKKGANGVSDVPNLSIPRPAAEGGVEAVKKELALVCELKK